jgi:hypothetical protein
MKRHLINALATTILVLGGPATLTGLTSPAPDCTCPQRSFGWVLFEDSNRGVPDFWWQDSLQVKEITICDHGINFLFLTEQHGNQQVAGLIFVNPSAELIETRLGLSPCDPRFRSELEHFRKRYSTLLRELNRMSGGKFETGGELDFWNTESDQKPLIINPARRLILKWRGEEIELRGYLDVYHNAVT